jgi:putative DNA primase/helicase|tara:strand:- start:513 stop:1886 length:1374 start_codon:yes stop_codon:yes gene_type:complete
MNGEILDFVGSSLSETDKADSLSRLEQLTHLTQDGIAECFAERYENSARYCPQHGSWYLWESGMWSKDDGGAVRDYIRRLSRAKNLAGQSHMGSLNFTNGAKGFAEADPALVISQKELDNDNYLLNTPGGTYNLRTQKMQLHNHLNYITKSTAVSPTSVSGGVFFRFLSEITLNDTELQKFLQRALGSMLSGAVEEHWIMFWIGDGRNGKNTLGDVVEYILGDYAKTISSSLLLKKAHDGHPTDIANLQGLRLATSSEIAEGAYLNMSLIKELTGDSTISGRFMHQNNFEFSRTHKHLVYCNSRPSLKTTDLGTKSRIKTVPFKANFAGREDPDLPEKLKREAGFILNWLIEGHQMWLDSGKKIRSCAAVDAMTADYYSSQPTPETWVSENCLLVTGHQPNKDLLTSNSLYQNYCNWSVEIGEQPLSNTLWGVYMAEHFERKRTPNGTCYAGIELKP